MTGERDRVRRAGAYVLGLMDEEERERAERDLEVDPAFRDAVLTMAERAHLFDLEAGQADPGWSHVLQRIAQLPQMRQAVPDAEAARPAIHDLGHGVHGKGLHAAGGWRGLVAALALIAAFALGFLAGRL